MKLLRIELVSLPPNWIDQDWHNLLYAGLVVLSIFIERKYHPIQKFKEGKFDNALLNGAFVYRIVPFGITFGWIFWLVLGDFEFGFNGNIIDFRAYNSYAVGHYLIWLAVFAVWLRYGWNDPLRGLIYCGIVAALHEGVWFVVYYALNFQNFWIVSIYYSPLFALLLSFFLAYHYLLPDKDKLSKEQLGIVLSVFGGFMLLWGIAGFHITADNVTGITQYFSNIDVNLEEDQSWWVLALVLCAFKLRSNAKTVLKVPQEA